VSDNAKVCANCEAPITGDYCARCGERIVDHDALTLRGFARSSFHAMSDLETGLLPTLKWLLTRPGFLTREYLDGRRRPYVRPLRLFLIINVLYFLVQPLLPANTFNTSLRGHRDQQVYSGVTGPVVERTLAERDVTLEAYTAAWESKSEPLARSLIIIMIPMLALAVALLQRGRGVPAVGHLVFTLHFYAYQLLVASIVLMLLLKLLYLAAVKWKLDVAFLFSEAFMDLLTTLVFVLYLVPAIRRVYGRGLPAALAQALLLAVAFFPVVFLYRFSLFWITWLLV